MTRLAAIVTLALAGAAAWSPASFAADPPTEPAAPPLVVQPPRALYASPLVNFEQLGRQPLGPLAPGLLEADGMDGRDGVPLDLQAPNGFTSFPQVAPPDGGGLVTLVE
jgi:hypothetical protein